MIYLENGKWCMNIPVVVTLGDRNIITVASWGWISLNIPMERYFYVAIRFDKVSYGIIDEIEKFTITIPSNLQPILKAGFKHGPGFKGIEMIEEDGFYYPKDYEVVYFLTKEKVVEVLGYKFLFGKLVLVKGYVDDKKLKVWYNETCPMPAVRWIR